MGRGEQSDLELLLADPPREQSQEEIDAHALIQGINRGRWRETLSAFSRTSPGDADYDTLGVALLRLIESQTDQELRPAINILARSDKELFQRMLWRRAELIDESDGISEIAVMLIESLTTDDEITDAGRGLARHWADLAADGARSVLPPAITGMEADLALKLFERGGEFQREFSTELAFELVKRDEHVWPSTGYESVTAPRAESLRELIGLSEISEPELDLGEIAAQWLSRNGSRSVIGGDSLLRSSIVLRELSNALKAERINSLIEQLTDQITAEIPAEELWDRLTIGSATPLAQTPTPSESELRELVFGQLASASPPDLSEAALQLASEIRESG